MSGSRLTATITAVLLALATTAGHAQPVDTERSAVVRSSALNPMPAQSGVVDPERYRLGPGDVLVLFVWGPISDTQVLEVGPDGHVFLPSMGAISVSGRTLADARREIEQRVRTQYRGVRVEVRLQRLRTFYVYLTGEVRQPGPVLARGSSRVADVLVDTLLTERASRRNIRVRHADGTTTIVDLGRFQRTGEGAGDPMRDGDVLQVGTAVAFVGVWGGVAQPAKYELGVQDSLSTLIRMGGGLLPSANRDRALLTRWGVAAARESAWVDLDKVASGEADAPLRDGDNLYVAYTAEFNEPFQVSVAGLVHRAGDYPIAPGVTRLTDVIRAAGGFTADADLSSIQLVRARPERVRDREEFERLAKLSRDEMTASEYESFRTQLAAMSQEFRIEWRRASNGNRALDPLLLDGDVIRVERLVRTVRVDGQVRRPGVFEHKTGESWHYYVRLAGGWTNRAARTQVRVTRAVNGQTVSAANAEGVSPGDFIWVPERPDQTTWQQITTVIAVAAQVATIVIAVKR